MGNGNIMDREAVKRLRRNLTLHFAVIAGLTAMLVASGTHSLFLPLLIITVCIVAFVFVDLLEWFHLGLLGSCLGMTTATGIAVASYIYSTFIVPSESGQLMAVAGLLVYPEAVLFLQRKNQRVYEQLAVFLLLEMVVAALVNDNLLFGLLLTPILLLWVSALYQFSRYSTLVSIDPSIETPMPKLAEVLYQRFVRAVMRRTPPRPLATLRMYVDNQVFSRQRNRSWLHAIPLGIGALAFAALFFFLTPRTSPGSLRTGLGEDRAVGLPDRLTFGNVGRILQNRTEVMQVKLLRGRSDQPYEVTTPPYLRARVFDTYGGFSRFRQGQASRGEWSFRSAPHLRRLPRQDDLASLGDRGRELVRLEFRLKSIANRQLYSAPPNFQFSRESPVPLRYDPVHMVFQYLDETEVPPGKSVRYTIGSYGFGRGEQVPVTPARLTARDDNQIDANDFEHIMRLTRGFSTMYRLDQYRRQLLLNARVPEDDLVGVAELLERHLAQGEFTYTLDLPPPADADLDPIEDFVINQKKGHCQFFASAMVAMLRQSGIPSRIVVGYRPREFNELGKYFTVRQSDAHAWVEALFRREDLQGTPYERWLTDADFYWVRFDPTAGGEALNSIQAQEAQAYDYAEQLWNDYVVEGNRLSATSSIYDPVAQDGAGAYAQLMAILDQLKEGIRTGQIWSGQVEFAWPLAMLVFACGTCLLLAWQVLRWLPRWAPRLARRLGVAHTAGTIQQRFYRQCLQLLGRLGLRRRHSETPEEFVRMASAVLATQGKPVSEPLQRLTDYYYRLRFGDAPLLEPNAMQDIQNCMQAVEQAVADRR
ncbi:MAG: transglutaminase domain-containing protein [Planctomycetota bacterium]|nr:MAG: transglutaminase domain-containing protein [Planctomycetota bacterium]